MSTFVPRSAWGPRHGTGNPTAAPQSRVVIHHAPERALPANPTRAQVAEQVRIIEDWHAQTLTPTNPRIGYQFIVVDQTAEVWEGLGWSRIGAHVANHNTPSLGILILGIDGDRSVGRPETWAAIARLVKEGIRLGHLTEQPVLEPHRKRVATHCPGNALAAFVEQLTIDDLLIMAEPARDPRLDNLPEYTPRVVTQKKPETPRHTPPHLEPIEVPPVPARIQAQPLPVRAWELRKWAVEVAENIGQEAYARRVPGAEALVDAALARLRELAAGAVPSWLLMLLWPSIEGTARRAVAPR